MARRVAARLPGKRLRCIEAAMILKNLFFLGNTIGILIGRQDHCIVPKWTTQRLPALRAPDWNSRSLVGLELSYLPHDALVTLFIETAFISTVFGCTG